MRKVIPINEDYFGNEKAVLRDQDQLITRLKLGGEIIYSIVLKQHPACEIDIPNEKDRPTSAIYRAMIYLVFLHISREELADSIDHGTPIYLSLKYKKKKQLIRVTQF